MLRSASLENKKFIREHWKDKDIKHFQSSDLLTEYYSVLNSIAKQYSYSELFKEIGLDFAEGVLGDPSLWFYHQTFKSRHQKTRYFPRLFFENVSYRFANPI